MSFSTFRNAVNAQIFKMTTLPSGLLQSSCNKDELFDLYLKSFTEKEDPLYIVNSTHNCDTCKSFIRDLGRVVAITDELELVSCWDITVEDETYQRVADALSKFTKASLIKSVYKATSEKLEVKSNVAIKDGIAGTITFDHFYFHLAEKYSPSGNRGAVVGTSVSNFDILNRSLNTINISDLETVLDLINSNSIYRGEEHLSLTEKFVVLKKNYDSSNNPTLYLWKNLKDIPDAVLKFKNSVIGTLASDLAEGMEIEDAVKRFEFKTAPTNYKRPSAVVTPKMIKAAQKTVNELGIEDSLHRRHATLKDITINNILWANATTVQKLSNDPFTELLKVAESKAPTGTPSEVTLEHFTTKILPIAKSIKVLVESFHVPNFVTLVAPCNEDSPNILKWKNNFTWSYTGNMADSIKDRVRAKGGAVDGDIRVSLSWFNADDLDIHLKCPNGRTVYFNNRNVAGFTLDLDMNGMDGHSLEPVENIAAKRLTDITEGEYTVLVNNYTLRNRENSGFSIEFEVQGKLVTFSRDSHPREGETIECFSFSYSRADGVNIFNEKLSSSTASTEVWNVKTQTYQEVSSIMWSPNHWDGSAVGNQHLFLMLEDCKNPDSVRGFYNEYLDNSLQEHRKVFEVLGSQLKAPYSEEQLSGLGFSTTKKGSNFTCLVKTTTGSKLITVVL